MKKKTYLLMALTMVSMGMNAQNSGNSSLEKGIGEFTKTMTIGGTIRSKYEYQTEEGEGRFEVRTARINVTGNVTPQVSYKAEIDLCDEGKIKMLDAYTRIKPWKTLQFTIGQERVPFTIDAHRSPHQQYFANRSDKVGGSTLGNLAMAQVSMNCVDIGLPQLAMHSCYETAGARDIVSLIRLMEEFYASHFEETASGTLTISK